MAIRRPNEGSAVASALKGLAGFQGLKAPSAEKADLQGPLVSQNQTSPMPIINISS